MPRYAWELPGADARCDSHRSGHQIHWVQFNQSMRDPGVVIPVTASVDDAGLVHTAGDDLSLVRWNHDPDLLRAALQRFDGGADWWDSALLTWGAIAALRRTTRKFWSSAPLVHVAWVIVIGGGGI